MIFYHYTSVAMAESCMNSGISKGHLTRSDGSIVQPIVWLTTDPVPYGHGLYTGRESVTDAQARHIARVTGKPVLSRVTVDKTAVRITVKIPTSDRKLISFEKFAEKTELRPDLYAKITGLSAFLNIKSLSDSELLSAIKNYKTKENTWWLYRGTINPGLFHEIGFRVDNDFVEYDFEKYGRKHFLDQGMAAVSAESLASLAKIMPAAHRFDYPKAFCVCSALDAIPWVIVRGGGFETIFSIDDARVIGQSGTVNQDKLIRWIVGRREELQLCWEQATESYRRYFPHANERHDMTSVL